ncbi:cytochrome P450 [Streptomyces lavenduligriseus]|uniref:Cytochrome P450 n=1 Tax=Streptomyces lavenduligriseus TaxID=67315 RepID=A0ABT0P416_9ACTN|nr:cytochrome P450 [Streptomyces lavenduligriseus]MCL3998331.1 cytochrome P450 [Streptomyces lavenduligriseus]
MLNQQETLAYPFAQAEKLKLHPVYAELRKRPLARVRMPYGEDAWLVTRYADAKAVLGDQRFSMAAAAGRDRPRVRPVAVSGGGLLSTDGPDHSRLRGTVARAFTARRVERLRDRVEEIAKDLVNRMTESGAPADLGDQFAFPLAITVIGELLGVNQDGHPRIRHWLDVMMSHTVTADEFHKWNNTFAAYTADLVELRRQHPGDDLFSALVRAHDQEGRISMRELLALTPVLISAGFVTTFNQISNSCYLLLARPDRFSSLLDRPETVPLAVEELLRYVPLPNGFAFPRYATEDVELGGVLVREGEPVLIDTAAANRDPVVFDDAEELVLDRAANPHLSFGHGPHFCIGAHLARVELQVALETLLEHLPGLELAVPEDALRWKTESMVNGLHELPVTW